MRCPDSHGPDIARTTWLGRYRDVPYEARRPRQRQHGYARRRSERVRQDRGSIPRYSTRPRAETSDGETNCYPCHHREALSPNTRSSDVLICHKRDESINASTRNATTLMGMFRLPGEYAGYEWFTPDGNIIPTESPYTDMPIRSTAGEVPKATDGPTRSTRSRNAPAGRSTPQKAEGRATEPHRGAEAGNRPTSRPAATRSRTKTVHTSPSKETGTPAKTTRTRRSISKPQQGSSPE